MNQIVDRITLCLESMLKTIEASLVGIPFSKTKSTIFAAMCAWMRKAAQVNAPVPCTMTIDPSNTLSMSKAIQTLTAEDISTIDFTQILSACSALNMGEFTQIPDSILPSFTEAFGLYMGRICEYGFQDKDTGKRWAFLVQSAKQAQVGKALCCEFTKRDLMLTEMGFDPREFDHKDIKKYFKVLMNTFSGQTPFVDNGAAAIRMQDVRAYAAFKHTFHISRAVHYAKDGKRSEIKYAVTETRPTDAVLVIIKEMLPFVYMRDMVECHMSLDEQIRLVEEGDFYSVYPDAEEVIKRWVDAVIQSRGAAMKGLTITFPVIKVGLEMAAEEGDDNPSLHLINEDIPLTISALARAGVYCLASEDVFKWDDYKKPGYFAQYAGGNSYLQACGVAHDESNLHKEVTLSRQLVTSYHGMSQKDIEDLYSMTSDLIVDSLNDDELITKMGLENTAFGMSIVEDRYQAVRRNAGFCKVLEKGTFVFACPEIRPIIAHIMGYDYRDHQSLRGAKCYMNGTDHTVVLDQRYPTLKMNTLFLRVIKGRDSQYYSAGVQILSLDTLYNASLKGDYDGDTPLATFPRSKKEDEFLAMHYDFDRIFMPDEDEISIDEFIRIMMVERTISCVSFARVVRAAYSGAAYTAIVSAYGERHNAM